MMSVRGSWSLLPVSCVGVGVGVRGQACGASGLPGEGWPTRRRKEEVCVGRACWGGPVYRCRFRMEQPSLAFLRDTRINVLLLHTGRAPGQVPVCEGWPVTLCHPCAESGTSYHLLFLVARWGRYYCSHFSEEETGAQRESRARPRPHSLKAANAGQPGAKAVPLDPVS